MGPVGRDEYGSFGGWEAGEGRFRIMTPDGRLRITGCKKEIIALSNGKKISPLPIEAARRATVTERYRVLLDPLYQ